MSINVTPTAASFLGVWETKTKGIDATQYKRRKGGEEGSWRGEERELLKNKSLRGERKSQKQLLGIVDKKPKEGGRGKEIFFSSFEKAEGETECVCAAMRLQLINQNHREGKRRRVRVAATEEGGGGGGGTAIVTWAGREEEKATEQKPQRREGNREDLIFNDTKPMVIVSPK